jgi:hypothetical protein
VVSCGTVELVVKIAQQPATAAHSRIYQKSDLLYAAKDWRLWLL